jgi:DnaJ-class molecular chaperone
VHFCNLTNYDLQHHPDKGGDADEFKKIQTAYDVLSDSDKVRFERATSESSFAF